MYHIGHSHLLHGDRSIERDDAQPGRDPGRWLALCVLCLAALMCAIDMTVTNVALPFLAVDLKANTDDLQWIIDSYTVVIAGLLLLGGGLADRYGRRPVFLTGFAVFGCSSFAAAFSSSPAQLIGLRALMGVGAAMLFTPALAILSVLFDESERPKAIALWTVFGAAGLAIGPVMGGILLDHFWWGSVFLINLPLTIVGIVLGVMAMPNSRKPGAPHLDVIGGLLSVGALGVLLYGIIQGPTTGWSAPSTALAIAGGLALGCAFVVWELRADAPMFNVRILRRRTASTGAISLFLVSAGSWAAPSASRSWAACSPPSTRRTSAGPSPRFRRSRLPTPSVRSVRRWPTRSVSIRQRGDCSRQPRGTPSSTVRERV